MSDRPRIQPKRRSEYPLWVRALLLGQRRKHGKTFDPTLLWGRAPRLLRAFLWLYKEVDRKSSPIEAALRALVCVRVSQLNDCAFCIDLNSSISIDRSVGDEKLLALPGFESSPLFSERERAALAYAEAMTDSHKRVDDALFARLRAQFEEDEIVELTALVAFQNLSAKFNTALGATAPGLCPLKRIM